MTARRPSSPQPRRRQRGAMFLMLAILLVTLLASGLLAGGSATVREQQRARLSTEALAQAKVALLAWTMARGDTGPPGSRPGELPCPDTNNDGLADAPCLAGRPGRLPWRTLGLPPLRDGEGEVPWYAVAAGFRQATQDPAALNSDRSGPLQLLDAGGNLLASGWQGLAAVLIAPGAAVAGQAGRPGNAPASYLEAAGAGDNRATGGPFVNGPVLANGEVVLNDRVLGISAAELIQAAERRALAEAQRALDAYATAHGGRLPNAADPADPACLAPIANVGAVAPCPGQTGLCSGRLPEDALAAHAAPWFSANGWGRVVGYTVRNDMPADATGPGCLPALSVDGTAVRAVLLAPGTPRAAQARPSALLSQYLDDPANADAWSPGPGQGQFITPQAGNDQLRSRP